MNRCWSASAAVLLVLCLASAPASAAEFHDDVMAGINLTAEEAEALEERLERNPQDLQARSQLVVYYFPRSHLDPAARRIHSEHALWLIQNAPQADVLASPHAQIQPFFDASGYNTGKSAWLGHIEREPDNVTFVAHAANFFSPVTDRELVVETLQKVQSLEPDNFKWPMLLGHQYLQESWFGEDVGEPSMAVQALEQFERAYEVAGSGLEGAHLLPFLAKAALRAKRYDDARGYGTAMLDDPSNGWDEGNQLHHGNLTLGRVALLEDDVETAKHHLLEAGKVSGSPQLDSFGPNMRLAADLLERGESDVVLEYFELCSNFWPRDELKDWAALVRGGRTPDFGGNLVY